MSGVNNFSGEGQGKIHHVVVSEKKVTPLLKKQVVTSEKVTTSEEVEKCNKNLDYMKVEVVKTRRKDLDNFEGQSKGSRGRFNLDHDLF